MLAHLQRPNEIRVAAPTTVADATRVVCARSALRAGVGSVGDARVGGVVEIDSADLRVRRAGDDEPATNEAQEGQRQTALTRPATGLPVEVDASNAPEMGLENGERRSGGRVPKADGSIARRRHDPIIHERDGVDS